MDSAVNITGFISGGLIGSDPWDPSSFSGSSLALFSALKDEGVLARAFGLEISTPEFMLRAAPRWHPDKETWRRRVYGSLAYRQALTRDLRRKIIEADRDTVILELGTYADGPAAYAGIAPVITYQDSLGAEYWSSPFVPETLRRDAKLRRENLSFEMGVAHGAARILISSDHMRQSFIDNYELEPNKVVNIGIGCNTSLPKNRPTKEYSRPEILFIGKEFHRKGGDLIAAAFPEIKAKIPGAILHVIGPPTRPDSLQDSPGVVFHGFLARENPAEARTFYEILERAALSVLPSRYEPAGIAPLEAMTYGAPAIVTNDWALKEYVEHGVTGFLLADLKPATIAATVIDALSDQERLARMAAAGFERTPERFSWRGVARRIIACAEEARAEFRVG